MNRNLRTNTSRILMALPIAAVAFSLAACAGAARPSADQLSEGIATILEDSGQGDLMTADQIDCVAEYFLDSEVTDQDLANIAEGKDLQTSEESKDLVTATMQDAGMECVS
ncbi:MAG: hypothetical protein ACTIKT_06515 [Microbacterium sp.]